MSEEEMFSLIEDPAIAEKNAGTKQYLSYK